MRAKSKAKAKSGTKEPQSARMFDMLKATAEQMHNLYVLKNEHRKILVKAAAEVVSSMISNDPAIAADSQLGQAVIAAARYLKKEFEDATQPDFPDPIAPPEEEGPKTGKQSDMEAAS